MNNLVDLYKEVEGKFFKFDAEKIIPVIFVGTMSSGKSTLINALLGTELLPSMNQACTRRVVKLLLAENSRLINMRLIDAGGLYKEYNKMSALDVSYIMRKMKYTDILIECEKRICSEGDKYFLFVDTPGVNNASDVSHRMLTEEELHKYDKAIVVYVFNAEQPMTRDDCDFLRFVKEVQNNKSQTDVIFVLNKADSIDCDKESITEFTNKYRGYLRESGFEDSLFFVTSAYGNMILEKALTKQKLSEDEEDEFLRIVKCCRRNFSSKDGKNLRRYAGCKISNRRLNRYGRYYGTISVGGRRYFVSELKSIIRGSSIGQLKRAIQYIGKF